MTLTEEILLVLTKAKEEIQANMANKGINASGRTSRGFAVEQDNEGVRLVLRHDEYGSVKCLPNGFKYNLDSVVVGTAPLSTLEIGREGGRVPRGFYYIIKEWTREKGLTFATESERQTFSYFTARKIMRQGTQRHYTPEDIWSTPVNNAAQAVRETASRILQAEIHNIVKTNFK